MKKAFMLLAIFSCLLLSAVSAQTEGELNAVSESGKDLGLCPLKHTSVKADISGFLARVNVTQEFQNNFNQPIEAVYLFPLPNDAAVDQMTMTVGQRVIRGKIMKRDEARQTYETAKNEGKTTALLDQERPNVFTQSVAHIAHGETVLIEISYVQTLQYDEGSYEFVFPMVVGERYNPAQVKDKQKITPKAVSTRTGHDISIEINLEAGVPVENIMAKTHLIETAMFSATRASIKLKAEKEIPNRDFVLRYDVSGKRIEDAILTHKTGNDGFFTLILQPPDRVMPADLTPKEIVFVLDTSGSMSGFPIEKAKEAMKNSLDGLNPQDTFNLITFAGDTFVLFAQPVPATAANLKKAHQFLATRAGGGGTEMMKAIKTALDPSDSQTHVRIVCFLTDGYVGNEDEIIAEVRRHPNARVFSFGIGESVNRYLLDKIAEVGKGEAQYVSLVEDGSKAARKFHERVRNPMLMDVSIDWNGMPVTDVYPKRIPDLFSAKPVIIHGRYTRTMNGTIKLKGQVAGQEIVREIPLNLPENEPHHDVLATLWARTKIEELSNLRNPNAQQTEEIKKNETIETKITELGLNYRLMTQYTSFVAVEELIIKSNGKPTKVDVPVYSPAGVRTDNVEKLEENSSISPKPTPLPNNSSANLKSRPNAPFQLSNQNVNPKNPQNPVGQTRTSPTVTRPMPKGPISGGVVNGKAVNLVKPTYPSQAKAVNASGVVNVQVVIDESGRVISATVVSGHPLLRAAAVASARASLFSPTMLSGKPVQVSGVIVFNFNPDNPNPTVNSATISGLKEDEPPLTKEDLRRLELSAKMYPQVLTVLELLEKNQTPTADFIKDGKAYLQLVLTDLSPATIEELKKLGFETDSVNKLELSVSGRIAPDKLMALGEMKKVTLIAPWLKK